MSYVPLRGDKMWKYRSFRAGVFAIALFVMIPAHAQESPPAKATCTFADGKTITVDYSSPRMRGRKIFGGLVPYGQEWRAGANEATTFVPNVNVTVGGKDVPAGKYTIFYTAERGEVDADYQQGHRRVGNSLSGPEV